MMDDIDYHLLPKSSVFIKTCCRRGVSRTPLSHMMIYYVRRHVKQYHKTLTNI